MNNGEDVTLGQEYEAHSASGEYYLGKGTAVAFSKPSYRVILENEGVRVDVPIVCCHPLGNVTILKPYEIFPPKHA